MTFFIVKTIIAALIEILAGCHMYHYLLKVELMCALRSVHFIGHIFVVKFIAEFPGQSH